MTITLCEFELPTGEAVVCEWDKHEGHLVRHCTDKGTFKTNHYPNVEKALLGFARMAARLHKEQTVT